MPVRRPARRFPARARRAGRNPVPDYSKVPAPAYKKGDVVATREAWGVALAALGTVDSRIVGLDADVKNSTFSDKFEKITGGRFFESFIAEQVMVGAAMGLVGAGRNPVPLDVCLLPDARGRFHPHGRRSRSPTSSSRGRMPACRSARTARRRWRSKTCR